MTTNRNRIDLHHHVIAPELAAELAKRNIDWTGGSGLPPWSLSAARETMARHGIASAVASVHPTPYWQGLGEPVRWTRYSNEFLARIVQDDPEHFGGFASLPLPDADAACRELEYALDVLHLDGVHLLTSEGGQYPGDPGLEELFQELEKRSAVVVFHPNTPSFGDQVKVSVPPAVVEYVFDTTRCIANLLYSGTFERYPSIRYIVPHAGGTIPFLALRIALGAEFSPALRARVPRGVHNYLRRLYYDTAVSAADVTLAALRAYVPVSQIVYGSDFPHIHGPLQDKLTTALDASPVFNDAERVAIDRDNALQLFPRFASVAV
jgi:predicted TIM-barrel fold metal-dependent hydrolase